MDDQRSERRSTSHTSTVYYLEGEVDTQQDESEGKARSSLCMCEANVSSQDQANRRQRCVKDPANTFGRLQLHHLLLCTQSSLKPRLAQDQCYYYSRPPPFLQCQRVVSLCGSVSVTRVHQIVELSAKGDKRLSVLGVRAVSYQPLGHWGALEVPLELAAGRQAAQVEDLGTCRWGLQGDEEASLEAFLLEEVLQRVDQPSFCLALAGLVPLGLSAQGGVEPWGGGPWGDSPGAWLHQEEALRDGAVGLRDEEEELRGVAGVLQGACRAEEAQGEVLDVVLGVGLGEVPGEALGGVLAPVADPGPEPEQRRRLQPAAPSADELSSLRTSAAPCGRPDAP